MHWIFVYSSTLTCQGWSTLTNTFFFPLAGQKKDLQNLISVSLITLHYRKRKDLEKQDLPSSVCALLFIINSKNDCSILEYFTVFALKHWRVVIPIFNTYIKYLWQATGWMFLSVWTKLRWHNLCYQSSNFLHRLLNPSWFSLGWCENIPNITLFNVTDVNIVSKRVFLITSHSSLFNTNFGNEFLAG